MYMSKKFEVHIKSPKYVWYIKILKVKLYSKDKVKMSCYKRYRYYDIKIMELKLEFYIFLRIDKTMYYIIKL